jgi:hypothetical protein
MTAVEFDIEGEGEDATLVADTSKVPNVVPEFDNLAETAQQGMAGGDLSSGGIVDSLKEALGVDSGIDQEKLAEATELADEYVERLQDHLEEAGQWEAIREAATQPSPE